MPTEQTSNSTPQGTGQGVGLRDAASRISGMLSDNFTITDTGHDDHGDRREPQQTQQRREPRSEQRQTQNDDNEPVVRDDVEEIDEDGNVRFRAPDDSGDEHEPGEREPGEHEDDDPDGEQHEPKGELKDDAQVTLATGDGKTETLTLGELKKGYLRTADYTRKTQALATERETIQRDRTDIGAERASLTASIEAVGRFVKEIIPPEPTAAEWDALRARDPVGYTAAREEWRSFKERLGGIEAAFRSAQRDSEAETQRTIRDLATKEKDKLADALPEWKDARVKKRDIADIFEAAKSIGFSEDEVRNTVDHRLMLMCLKAAKYDRLMAARKGLKQENRGRSSNAEPANRSKVMEPGSRTSQLPSRKTAVVNARDAHRKTQSVRSGAALIERLLD